MESPLQQPRRRWLRFSLRSLMLLVLVVAVSLGWAIHKAREQGIAVAALKELGCSVTYYNAQRSPTVIERLRKLLGEDESRTVRGVSGNTSQITDAGLAHLRGLTQLQFLILDNTQITDAGMMHLRGLTQLGGLGLDNTQVTDAGLVHLQGLTQLKKLVLSGTKMTDEGLVHLQGLAKLYYLGLDKTQVTDAGLVHLERLTQLGRLDLRVTPVTDVGVQRLQKALPNCKVGRNP